MSEVDIEAVKAEAVRAALAPLEAEKAKMQAKLDELLGETKEAKRKAKEAEEQRAREVEEALRKSGDVAALEKSWQDKLARQEAEWNTKHESLSGHLRAATVSREAVALASELAVPGSASVLLPHIERRLTLDYVDGKPAVRVLDKDGKPSAATLAELRKEIEADASFAPLIVATKASGAGGPGGKGSGAASKTIKRADFDRLPQHERFEFAKSGGTVTD